MPGRIAVVIAVSASLASAHTGEPLQSHDLWRAWDGEPGFVLPLALAALLYARGARAGRGVTRRESFCFWAGWTTLVVAVASPLHRLGEVLFSAHMAQHEILMLVSAPLLVLSRPLVPMLWGLPMNWRRYIGGHTKTRRAQIFWRTATRPWTAWWTHAGALWLWHIPSWFQATLVSGSIHAAQHVSFLGSALLFWWSLFYPRERAAYGAGMLYVFTTAVHTSILGALLTFTRQVWYPAYRETQAWGLPALEDQQLGGLIMWIPAGLVYLAAGLGMFALWLRESDLMANRSGYAQ
jgi:putative membrane protein